MLRVRALRIALEGGGEAVLLCRQWLACAEPGLGLFNTRVENLKPHALHGVCPLDGATVAPFLAGVQLEQQLVEPPRRGAHRRGTDCEICILRPQQGLVLRPRHHSVVEDVLPAKCSVHARPVRAAAMSRGAG